MGWGKERMKETKNDGGVVKNPVRGDRTTSGLESYEIFSSFLLHCVWSKIFRPGNIFYDYGYNSREELLISALDHLTQYVALIKTPLPSATHYDISCFKVILPY